MSFSHGETRPDHRETDRAKSEHVQQGDNVDDRIDWRGAPPDARRPPPDSIWLPDPEESDNYLTPLDIKTIAASSSVLWLVLLGGGRLRDVQLTIDADTMLAMSGMAIGIGTLVFATLAVVSTTTRQDWLLRIVLLALGTVFTALALGGFIQVVTWSTDIVETPVDLYLVLALFLMSLVQIDWFLMGTRSMLTKLAHKRTGVARASIPVQSTGTSSGEVELALFKGRRRWFRYALLAMIPIASLVPSTVHSAVLLLAMFAGALLTLTMTIAVITLTRLPVASARDMAETRVKATMRAPITELDAFVLKEVDELQAEMRPHATDAEMLSSDANTIPMVSWQALVLRLRAKGRRESDGSVKAALARLTDGDYLVARKDGWWTVPTDRELRAFQDKFTAVPIVVVRSDELYHTMFDKEHYIIDGLHLSQIRRELAVFTDSSASGDQQLHVPVHVLQNYYLPLVPRLLANVERFSAVRSPLDSQWTVYISTDVDLTVLRSAYADVHHDILPEDSSTIIHEDICEFQRSALGRMTLGHRWGDHHSDASSMLSVRSVVWQYLCERDPNFEQFLEEYESPHARFLRELDVEPSSSVRPVEE